LTPFFRGSDTITKTLTLTIQSFDLILLGVFAYQNAKHSAGATTSRRQRLPTKNKEQRTKNKELRTKNQEQPLRGYS
jgi:hypothetical protein